MWSLKNYEKLQEIKEVGDFTITHLDVSNDGYHLLAGLKDGSCKLLDLRMFKVIKTYAEPDCYNSFNFNKICFAKKDNMVISGSINGNLYAWNTHEGILVDKISASEAAITGCLYNELFDMLYAVDYNGNIIRFN